MKIVIIGGTGRIGSRVVANLRAQGHEAVAAAPDTGVNTLTGDAGYTVRTNLSPNGTMDLLVQDASVNAGATPAPRTGTGSGGSTVWMAATVVFAHG